MLQCDCIQRHLNTLRERFGPETELLNTKLMFNLNGGGSYETLEPLRFRFHPKRKDGKYSKKWQSSYLHFNYCPFCGTKDQPAGKKRK